MGENMSFSDINFINNGVHAIAGEKNMKIKFLGTAAAEGIPGIFCDCDTCEKARKNGGEFIGTRSQSVVDNKILIDFPPDTYHHILTHGLKLHKIHTLIITHPHF